MFLDFFYGLRDEGVPTSIQEWQMLMSALEKGLHSSNLLSFYHLSRATLVKIARGAGFVMVLARELIIVGIVALVASVVLTGTTLRDRLLAPNRLQCNPCLELRCKPSALRHRGSGK